MRHFAALFIVCLFWASQSSVSGAAYEDTSQEVNEILEQQTREIKQVKEELEKQKAELAKQNETKYSNWNVYWVPLISPLAALIAAIGGWFITYRLLKNNFAEQELVRKKDWEAKEDERREIYLVDALRYFEGRTQKRSIGIAFVEANWDKFPNLRETWTAVLTNQAIYILTKILEDNKLTQHELDNLERIFAMLKKGSSQSSRKERIQQVMNKFTKEVVEKIDDDQLKTKICDWKNEFKPAANP
jgi:uncharacterized protein YneF (UPF0154 family)